jgi:major membrane immunogen (membrane-anchored lipoprotein)
MKNTGILTTIVSLVTFFFVSSLCSGQDLNTPDKPMADSSCIYNDGSYAGTSRAIFTGEPFWGIARIVLRNDSITDISFIIRDSMLHETFDGKYEKHFENNPVYILQSRADWNGVQYYTEKLSELKSLDKVDAISGATWSYKIFKASVNDALKNAKRQVVTMTLNDTIK